MAAVPDLTEEEKYLLAILLDQSGVDAAEFSWTDETSPDGIFRCYDYQYAWFRDQSKLLIDQCLAEGALILTSEGHKPIEDVRVGDLVLTHRNRWRPVTAVMDRGQQDCVSVKGVGHFGLRMTEGHPLYVREFARKRKVELLETSWKPVTQLTWGNDRHHKWATPERPDALPLPAIQRTARDDPRNAILAEHLQQPEFWWLIGVWVAEGSINSSHGKGGVRNRAEFAVNLDLLPKVEDALRAVGFTFQVTPTASWPTVVKVVVSSYPFTQFLMDIAGRGAKGKRLHPSVFGMSHACRTALLEGALSGDGHCRSRREGNVESWTYTTVSRSLAFDMRILATTLGMQSSVAFVACAGQSEILGRQVTILDQYAVSICPVVPGVKARVRFDQGHGWSRVTGYSSDGCAPTYDLEVADDHSFVAEGVVVHNCGRAVGKALGIDTPVPTPTGWTTMGDLKPGDTVFDDRGGPTTVMGVSDVMIGRPCYRVTFDDSTYITADAEHLWLVYKKSNRVSLLHQPGFSWNRVTSRVTSNAKILTTVEMRDRLQKSQVWMPMTRSGQRQVISIEPVDSVPVRCIRVDAPSHLFQAGPSRIPTHNSLGIQMRAFAFPFCNPGEEMLVTAPEMIHLDPVTQGIERRLSDARLSREFLKTSGTSSGFTHRPFEARFRNGARIIGRIPQKDGKGVKGSLSAATSDICYSDAMLITDRGLVPASSITAGTLVLTHAGRFRPVVHIYRYEAEAVEVAGAGHRGMVVSANHRFMARRNTNPQRTRNLASPTWVCVDDPEITKRWYWASPAEFPAVDIPLDFFPVPYVRGEIVGEDGIGETGRVYSPFGLEQVPLLMTIVGRYLADGVMHFFGKVSDPDPRPSRISFVDDAQGVADIAAVARLLGYAPKRQKHQNASSISINNPDLAAWMFREFGRLSDGKHLPGWVFGAPRHWRQALLDGYLAGDGHWNETRARWEIGSASKQLAMGLKLVGQSLGYQTSFSWVDPKIKAIDGIELKTEPKRSYRVQFSTRGHGIFEDGYLWSRIRKVIPVGAREVFDIVVADDFSYIGDGIVHRGSAFLPDGTKALSYTLEME